MWPFKSKPKAVPKELEVLAKLLTGTKLETSTSWSDLTFKINLEDKQSSFYSRSRLEFKYNAIYEAFHGYLYFQLDGVYVSMAWYDPTFEKDKLYKPILELVKQHFDLDTKCQEFQKAYEQSKVDEKQRVSNVLDKYARTK
jgi:hypothetical protein